MPADSKAKTKAKLPWKKPAPAKERHTRLSPAEKAAAKNSAQKAGRPYPNLVDNMKVVKKLKAGKKT